MMRHSLPCFLLLVLGYTLPAQKTIYVKSDAAGANTGVSWQDAYTALSDALNAAADGDQVWVTAGTYKPAATPPNSSFALKAGVALYGGFAGTETSLSGRNPATNVTILSGDLAGDDVAGTFTSKRSDNSTHVILVSDPNLTGARAILDGCTISGGQTLAGNTNPDLTRRGGGVLTTAKLTVRNCRFTDNNAETGGGLAVVTRDASGTLVDNCLFEKNNATTLGAGMFFRDVANGSEVNRCIFSENKTVRGTFYVITSAGLTVDSCQFLNNDAGLNPCAGMYTWQTLFTMTNTLFKGNKANDYGAMYNDGRGGVFPFTIEKCRFEDNVAVDATTASNVATAGAIFNATTTSTIKNCIFLNNSAHAGGAIYLTGTIPGNKNIIDGCTFEGNKVSPGASTSAARGGALFAFKANYEVRNSNFNKNTAINSGGHLHNADSTLFYYNKCRFENGTANFGGGISNYNAGDVGIYDDCVFTNNTGNTSGGAMTTGFTANATLKNCLVETNSARSGGGLFVQNTNSKLTLLGCSILSNTANGSSGGGVNVSAGITFTVDQCLFSGNTGDIGGAINFSDDTVNVGNVIIRNTTIQNNFANTQAAGLNISNANAELSGCLFFSNVNSGAGAGGAVSNNASGKGGSTINAVNCTFADNSAAIGGGIAQWQDSIWEAKLTLQNCIFFNNVGVDYEVEDGTPVAVSKGGNFSGDQSLAAILTGTNDILGLDPLFVDPAGAFDYHLKAGSPCIDKGIAAGAPPTDIEGKPRVGAPDQGCYEFQSVGTQQPLVTVMPLRLSPNPAVAQTTLTLEGDWSEEVQVYIHSRNGALVQQFTAYKTPGRWAQSFSVSDLPAGIYSVRIAAGLRRFEGSLVKVAGQ